jgi:hypothetical protein
LLQTIQDELISLQGSSSSVHVSHALFVALQGGKGMDSAVENVDQALLHQVDPSYSTTSTGNSSGALSFRTVVQGTLKQVNDYCRHQDELLAKAVINGDIDGLICISMHTLIFQRTLQAAAIKKIPVTGSGGTSLSQAAASFGISLVGNAGGSVATTTYTRAVSYTHALASHWKLTYEPWEKNNQQQQQGPTWTSVLNACLPVFWGVCTTKYILQTTLLVFQGYDMDGWIELPRTLEMLIHGLENWALPTACSVIMATATGPNQRDQATSSLVMAAVIGSMGCSQSILAGLLAGWLVSRWAERLLVWCIFHNIPATMTNMLTSGGVGSLVTLATLPFGIVLRQVTAMIRNIILLTVTSNTWPVRTAGGFIWGCLSCYGSKVGWYHAFHLPLSLVEMELGEPSFFGAIDELTLVLVSAGICLGTLLTQALAPYEGITDADASLCRRGLGINILFGDFIEAAYPYMDRHVIINVGGYLASGLSSAWLVASAASAEEVPKSLAYMPLAISIMLASGAWKRMMLSSMIAAGVSMVATLLHHLIVGIPAARRKGD